MKTDVGKSDYTEESRIHKNEENSKCRITELASLEHFMQVISVEIWYAPKCRQWEETLTVCIHKCIHIKLCYINDNNNKSVVSTV